MKRYCVGSYKVIATPQMDFVSVKYWYVHYCNSRGYRMGEPGNRIVKRTHSLFVDDLKVY